MIIKPKKWKEGGSVSAKRPRFRGLVTYMLKGKGTERCTWYDGGKPRGNRSARGRRDSQSTWLRRFSVRTPASKVTRPIT